VAVFFMVGSTCFALGSFPPYWRVLDPRVVGITFFVGSVFFTAAALSQLVQVRGERRLLIWACAVQVVGTLLFNLNTFDAMFTTFDTQQENRLVWGPDMLGSAAFLVASHLAWMAVCDGWWCVRRDVVDWWVAALNYVGSIFFGLSALAAFTLPTTGDVVNLTVVNAGTFLGAVCFFVGAYLLLPARVRQPSPPS
jgi:YrhK-like protein